MNELYINMDTGLLTLLVMVSLSMMESWQSSANIKQEIMEMMVRWETMIGQIGGLVSWLSGYDRLPVTDMWNIV